MQELLKLSHKTYIEDKCAQLGASLSEYSFANLYLFRKVHNYTVLEIGKFSFIQGKTYDEHTYLMPLFVLTPELTSSLKKSLPTHDFFFPIPEEWITFFPASQFSIEHSDADSDYLYSVAQIASYSGRNLSKKRNLVRQFLDTYLPKTKPLDAASRIDATQVVNEWQASYRESKERTDFYPVLEAIELSEKLGLQGEVYYIDGVPKGLIIGGRLSDKTFLIHFAKADSAYKGLYQFMYQDFTQRYLQSFTEVNMEQDLGKTELRQTKKSYEPTELSKKYRIKLLD